MSELDKISESLKNTFRGVAAMSGGNYGYRAEILVCEIASIMQETPDNVRAFYTIHSLSLDYIKQAALAGARLDEDDMREKLYESRFGDLSKPLNELIEWRHSNMTFKEKIIDKLEYIPYYIGYYFSYPILWIADWLWSGIKEAYEDTWE